MAPISLEERVTSLENILANFITTTGTAIERLEKEMKEFKDEMKEFKNEMKEFKDQTNKVISELNKKFGDMTRKLGTIVEDLVFPCVPKELEQKFGIQLSFFGTRIKRFIKTSQQTYTKEFDAIGLSEDSKIVYLCYVKTTLRDKDVELFDKELEYFQKFFPEYSGKKLVCIMASMNYSDELLFTFEKYGFIYMAPSGYALEIKNTENFKLKFWDL